MSVHYAAWAVFYFMASMTTVMASEVRSVTYTTTHHLAPTGFNDWTVRLSTRLSSAIGCALQCAQHTHCIQFQWNDGLCHLNAHNLYHPCHGSCAIIDDPGCRPPIAMKSSEIQEVTTENCYTIGDRYYRCLTPFYKTTLSICRYRALTTRDIADSWITCLVFNFTERGPGHFIAQVVGTDLFLVDNANTTYEMDALKVAKTDPDLVDFTLLRKNSKPPVYVCKKRGSTMKQQWYFSRLPKCE